MLKILMLWSLAQVQSTAYKDPLKVTIQPAPIVLPATPPVNFPGAGQTVWTQQTSGTVTTSTLTRLP